MQAQKKEEQETAGDVINVNELHSDGYSPLMIAIGAIDLRVLARAQPHVRPR